MYLMPACLVRFLYPFPSCSYPPNWEAQNLAQQPERLNARYAKASHQSSLWLFLDQMNEICH